MYFWRKSQKEYFVDRLNYQEGCINELTRSFRALRVRVDDIRDQHNKAMKAIDEAIACKHPRITGYHTPVTDVVDAIVEHLGIRISEQLKVTEVFKSAVWGNKDEKEKK